MTNPASAFLPAIEALEGDLADLERQANGLLQSINLLREKAGLPPRPGGWSVGGPERQSGNGGSVKLNSDTFTGKKLGSAVREYLEMRERSGIDKPATSREIFDALKDGGFVSGAKDDATGMVVLRTMLRKNTAMFVRLQSGKYGLRSWYPNLRQAKEVQAGEPTPDDIEEGPEPDDESETAAVAQTAAAS